MDNFLGKLRLAKLNPLEFESLKKTVSIEETKKKYQITTLRKSTRPG